MRTGMTRLTIRILALSLPFLPLSTAAAGPVARKPTPAEVRVRVDQRGYPAGSPVKITVSNGLKRPIALPGCASYTVEQFVGEEFVPLPPQRCEWERAAILVPPGEHSFKFEPAHDQRTILRVGVTYGVGCREGVPLSLAQCERFDTAWSATFVVLQAPEP